MNYSPIVFLEVSVPDNLYCSNREFFWKTVLSTLKDVISHMMILQYIVKLRGEMKEGGLRILVGVQYLN